MHCKNVINFLLYLHKIILNIDNLKLFVYFYFNILEFQTRHKQISLEKFKRVNDGHVIRDLK